jgi:hypothetical protein
MNRKKLLEKHIKSFKEQYTKNNIEERLDKGQIVIIDRNVHTIIAMQLALGLSFSSISYQLKQFNYPGKVVYIDIDPEITTNIRKDSQNKLKGDVVFQKKIKYYFDWMSDHYHGMNRVNGNQSVENVFKEILMVLNLNYNFEQAIKERNQVDKKYLTQGTKAWSIKEIILDMSYQVGNLSKSMLQKDSYVRMHGMSAGELDSVIETDVVDMLSLVLSLAERLDMDVDKAFKEHIQEDIEKIERRIDYESI